jgi:N-acetyl-S-(2-succino)cysteine monooxygenase
LRNIRQRHIRRLPRGLTDFVEHVVPLLQRRGVFRREYEGSMLRDHYGLPRPASRFARAH